MVRPRIIVHNHFAAHDEQAYEPDEIDHKGKRYAKTNEMIPFNGRPARKYKSGIYYITREVESGKIHE